jgi:large subunit ribosomal protein L7/L12
MAAKHEKLIEEIKGLTLLEVSDLVKALEEAFGVSAAMPTAAVATVATAAAAAPAEAEKANYKVTLQSAGADKIKVIKAVKALIPNLNLADAKAKVEEAPTVISDSVPKEEAMKMKKELEAAGAKVELA